MNYQWTRTESLEINSWIYGQMISTRVPTPFNRERIVFSINRAEETGRSHAKE